MEGVVMDIFRALAAPSLDVRRKVMDLCLGNLVTPRNVGDVINLLKKEVVKTMGHEAMSTEGNLEYRRLLIRALHACVTQHADVAQTRTVMMVIMDFLTESDTTTASEVVMFLRELVASTPELRGTILQRLADLVGDMSQARVLRGSLWLLGEYCEDQELVRGVIDAVLAALRPLPLELAREDMGGKKEGDSDGKDKKPTGKYVTQTVVLADGTYGTKTVFEGGDEEAVSKDAVKKAPLRGLILGGDTLLATAVGGALTRLALRAPSLEMGTKNEILFVLSNFYKLAVAQGNGERADGVVRITQCIRALVAASGGSGGQMLANSQNQRAAAAFCQSESTSGHSRQQLAKVLEIAQQSSDWLVGAAVSDEAEDAGVAPDSCPIFRQLRERKGAGGLNDVIDEDDLALGKGSIAGQAAADGALFAEKLSKAKQMTGLADAVYVEAFLQVHTFDLVLELLVVNRTNEVMENVMVELSTQGDLKIVDRPMASQLQPGQQVNMVATIKVSSTETGVIFGYVSHDKKSGEKETIALNELHVDILDYIEMASVSELAFHGMWSEFEWENKININSTITEVGQFLGHIMKNTNMSVVGRSASTKTADAKDKANKKKVTDADVEEMLRDSHGIRALIESSSFVAVNLYAKSIFGEDALANVSIEKLPDGKLTGSVRIRSRTQGIALSLGDRVTLVQRSLNTPGAKK
eukprot:TRINITY_DN1497_c0_g1_i2.p1 TRINITY_DN1497_c0_g1~~TRINITY_DN1497_c0_g1_i2.p1  ORF type:complete len:697 (-),score=228.01 TRINITY_DN1497_c0_g1_i2:151-2241(-)